MKKLVTLGVLLIVGLFSACSDSLYTGQRQFQKESLYEISPQCLIYNESTGKNWWNGSYKDRPVLIHAVKVVDYVNVDIIFLD